MRTPVRSWGAGLAFFALSACSSRVGEAVASGLDEGGDSEGDDAPSTGSTDVEEPGADSTDGADSDSEPPMLDLLVDDPPPPACVACSIELEAEAAGGFELLGGDFVAGVTFRGVPVYSAGHYGEGRFIAAADTSFLFGEMGDCPIHAWLAARDGPPRVFWFGWTGEETTQLPIDVTSAGVHLPDAYLGRPDLLAAEFDIVVYTEASWLYAEQEQPEDAELQTLLDYVSDFGGGLYVGTEYAQPGGGYLGPLDLWSVNRLLQPLGLRARGYDLGWGSASTELDCFETP